MVVGRGEKIYFAVPAQALLGGTSCRNNRPPKRDKFKGKSLGAYLKRKRESIYTVAGKKCYGRLRNETNLPLSGKGECRTDLVVGKYAQTR